MANRKKASLEAQTGFSTVYVYGWYAYAWKFGNRKIKITAANATNNKRNAKFAANQFMSCRMLNIIWRCVRVRVCVCSVETWQQHHIQTTSFRQRITRWKRLVEECRWMWNGWFNWWTLSHIHISSLRYLKRASEKCMWFYCWQWDQRIYVIHFGCYCRPLISLAI